MSDLCCVCRKATDFDTCDQCMQPVCEEHYVDMDVLGFCTPCKRKMDEQDEE